MSFGMKERNQDQEVPCSDFAFTKQATLDESLGILQLKTTESRASDWSSFSVQLLGRHSLAYLGDLISLQVPEGLWLGALSRAAQADGIRASVRRRGRKERSSCPSPVPVTLLPKTVLLEFSLQ